jgi:hypothetical protein
MQLEGSCECGKIRFTVASSAPHPYRICYCRRCRKIGGGVGAAINILAEADSLTILGELEPKAYEAAGGLKVKFCPECATALFIELAGWPKWVYPFASAIDSALPVPPHRIHIQWGDRVDWSPVVPAANDAVFEENAEESILEWHERMRLVER